MISGAFLFSLMLLGSVAIVDAATLETANWEITVTETETMRLDFAIEYNGELSELTAAQELSVEPDVPETDTETTVEVPVDAPLLPGVPGTIVINEFVSDPVEGGNEWVELYNAGSSPVDLEGWRLFEGAGRATALEGELGVDEYLIVEPRGNLNNSGDTIYLLDPYDTEIDRVTYGNWDDGDESDNSPSAANPDSVGRDPSGVHHVMTPTPDAENAEVSMEVDFSVQAENDTEETTSDVGTSRDPSTPANEESEEVIDKETPESAINVALSNVRNYALGTEIITEGTVAAAPGVLGKQFFYLAGSGIQTYLHSADFPALERGMQLRVKGVLTSISGESRLKLTQASDIQIIGVGDAPSPHDVTSSMIGEATEGWLVRLTGMITEKSTGEFMLMDDEGDVRVYIRPSTGIAITSDVGDDITVTGIVSQTSAGYRILPRDQQDLLPRTPENDDEEVEVLAGIVSDSNNSSLLGWLLTTFALLSLAVAGAVYYIKKKYPKSRILLNHGK